MLRFSIKFASLFYILHLTGAEEDSQWVWKDGQRSASRVGHAKQRYEIFDTSQDFIQPDYVRPIRPPRPPNQNQGLGFPDRPFPNRPPLGLDRPDVELLGGAGQGPGILTGPVPSWVKEPPVKHYDSCKCAEKFNCNSPGISYGQCDVGKQYCCYNSKKHGITGGPLPSRPVHSPENGILVGPGGPVDGPLGDRPGRPYPRPPGVGIAGDVPVGPGRPYPRPPGAGLAGDVLVGPGGPTGIIGRPPKGPFGGGFGEYDGPGGGVFRPPGGAFRPPPGGFGYGPRSAKKD